MSLPFSDDESFARLRDRNDELETLLAAERKRTADAQTLLLAALIFLPSSEHGGVNLQSLYVDIDNWLVRSRKETSP